MRGVVTCFEMIHESDTLFVDIKNVDMNYKAKVHECIQRVTYNQTSWPEFTDRSQIKSGH